MWTSFQVTRVLDRPTDLERSESFLCHSLDPNHTQSNAPLAKLTFEELPGVPCDRSNSHSRSCTDVTNNNNNNQRNDTLIGSCMFVHVARSVFSKSCTWLDAAQYAIVSQTMQLSQSQTRCAVLNKSPASRIPRCEVRHSSTPLTLHHDVCAVGMGR